MLGSWRETEGWLVLSPSGIPPVYLSLARLKEEGLYGRVRALAVSNAPEFKYVGSRKLTIGTLDLANFSNSLLSASAYIA